MAVNKSDRAAVRKLSSQNRRLGKKKAALIKRVLALKSKAQVLELEAGGLLVSADEIERQIQDNSAKMRGYSYGG